MNDPRKVATSWDSSKATQGNLHSSEYTLLNNEWMQKKYHSDHDIKWSQFTTKQTNQHGTVITCTVKSLFFWQTAVWSSFFKIRLRPIAIFLLVCPLTCMQASKQNKSLNRTLESICSRLREWSYTEMYSTEFVWEIKQVLWRDPWVELSAYDSVRQDSFNCIATFQKLWIKKEGIPTTMELASEMSRGGIPLA